MEYFRQKWEVNLPSGIYTFSDILHLINQNSIIMAKKSNTPAFDKLKAAQSRAQNPSPKKGSESKSDSEMKSMRKTALNNISPGMLKPNKKKR